MHVVSDSAPHEDEYFPAPHFMQSEAALPAYFPASQSQHSLADVAPDNSEYLPVIHSQHTFVVAPTADEYFPASHLRNQSFPPWPSMIQPSTRRNRRRQFLTTSQQDMVDTHISPCRRHCTFRRHRLMVPDSSRSL